MSLFASLFAPRERRNEEMSDTRVGFRASGKEVPAKPAFPNHAGTPIGERACAHLVPARRSDSGFVLKFCL
jgi:hypothetical protein